jgi:hypothetical protein
MSLSHEQAGLKILAKIKIYILSRAKLLCTVWDETPCTYVVFIPGKIKLKSVLRRHLIIKMKILMYGNQFSGVFSNIEKRAKSTHNITPVLFSCSQCKQSSKILLNIVKNSEDPKSISGKITFALRMYVHIINDKRLVIWLIVSNNEF